ncbi:hypothetical protein [Ferruginibacter sp. SUN106]|uniref:hypothetical protein n=1 Tax=Ferruginibacter sp. SUN106 TaxID=2978348 RepID=UPI003D35F57A
MQISCKKTDSILPKAEEQVTLNGQPVNVTEHFFALPANASSAVKRVAVQMRKQNSNKEFITSFVKNNGFVIWDKAIISVGKPKVSTGHLGENNVENNADTIVILPLVQADSVYVGGFLKAVIADTVSIDLYKNRDYQALPYAGSSSVAQSNVTTAENFALRMMLMDNLVFGYTKFEMRDKKLFAGNSNADTNNIIRVVEFGNSSNNFNGGGTTSSNYIYSVCVTVTTTTYTTSRYCGTETYCAATVGYGLCDNCGTYCYLINTPHTSSTTDCEYWEDGGSGVGSWPDFPSGGGGGTGGGGTTPCGFVEAITESVVPVNCPLIPNPWPVSIRDANGYLYAKIAELKAHLSLEPFALDPCDSLNIMPLDPVNGFGSMWQRVAQFTPSSTVTNRLDSLRIFLPNGVMDNYNLTNLNSAYGSVVNCDFFPIRITQLPPGYTPEFLVEYFRQNINSFIDSSLKVKFSAYEYDNSGTMAPPYYFYDTAKFYAYAENSLGALIHISMWPNDGSVVESDYFHNITNGKQSHGFKFSTLKTPIDYNHPVAGNREFGIYKSTDVLHPNDYVFYTMGVDRISDEIFALGDWLNHKLAGNPTGFEIADKLWRNMQTKFIQFVISQGGQASFYSVPEIKARPKWNEVDQFLKGFQTWEQLKIKLGC